MATQKNKGVVWAIAVLAILYLLVSFYHTASLSGKLDDISADNAGLRSDLHLIVTDLQTAANALASSTITVNTSQFDAKFNELCDEIDGCGSSWDVPSRFRSDAEDAVVDELTENDNRDLYRLIRGLVEIDDKEDIEDVTVHQLGDVTTNEDPARGWTESRTVDVDLILEVEFYEDGDNDDTKTKYFKIHVFIDDLDNGYDDGDFDFGDAGLVSSRYVLA